MANDLATLREADLANVRATSIGFIFQTFNLIPTLSAQENVETALAPLGVKPAERRERAAVALRSVGSSRTPGASSMTMSPCSCWRRHPPSRASPGGHLIATRHEHAYRWLAPAGQAESALPEAGTGEPAGGVADRPLSLVSVGARSTSGSPANK